MKYTYNYPRPAVCVDCIVIARGKQANRILLVERGREPFKDQKALPGGFVDMDEKLEESALRELREETGLVLPAMTQFMAYGDPGRDPRGRTVSVVFYAVIDSEPMVQGSDDAQSVAWVNLNDLPSLAFDHSKIVSDFVKQIWSVL